MIKKIAYPLEIRKSKRTLWDELDYICYVIIGKQNEVKKRTLEYMFKIYDNVDSMFVVIWDFCIGMNTSWCMEKFNTINLIKEREDLLVFEILDKQEICDFLEIWGETDHMEFVCPEEKSEFIYWTEQGVFSTFNKYRKGFLDRVLKIRAIITDSGDGEETQFVVSKEIFNLLINEENTIT